MPAIPMQVVQPLTINDSRLTSTNVAENDYAAWNPATSYAVGDRVIRTTGVHKIFERLVAGTTATAPESDTVNWLEVSATNAWKMFDTVNSSQTTNADTIEVTITPGQVVNTVALLNVSALTIQIVVDDPVDGVVYDETFDMQSPPLLPDWYNYFFDPITQKRDLVAQIPSYGSADIDIVIDKTGNTAACGTCLLGKALEIGDGVQYGARVGIQDYSRKERNQFGDFIIVQRSFSKRANWSMLLPNSQVDSVQQLLADLRTTPTLYIGSSEFASTFIFGYYKDFDITIQYVEHSICSLELEGLT